nr:META domain-containing protein [uncultured Cetobacterium sp.]
MKKILMVLSMAAFLFGGCSNLMVPEKKLTGKEFILVQENGIPNIIIGFDSDNFYGFSGVNNYFGRYEKSGKSIKLERMGATLMAGPERLMDLEQNYYKELETVKKYSVKGDELTLITDDGKKMIFKENKKVD